MKPTLLFLTTLFSCLVYSQKQDYREIDREWATKINAVFENLDFSKVPYGILLDYAMEFTDVTAYNGTLTDSTAVNSSVFSNIYKTLVMGRVTTDTIYFPRMETIAHNWMTYRKDLNQNLIDENPVLVLSGLYYNYSKLDEKALEQNRIKVEGEKIYDSYDKDGEWQNPYQELQTIAFALPIESIDRKNFGVILPEDLFLSNGKENIKKIEIDFDDDRSGYKEIVFGQRINVSYSENGIYHWTIRTTLANGEQLVTKIIFSVEDYTNPNQTDVPIFMPSNSIIPKVGAVLRIQYAPSHNGQIKKPFIIAEGFDSRSLLRPESLGGDRTLKNFLEGNEDLPNSGWNLWSLLTQEYDLIYIDWRNGTDNIKSNSEVLREVIKWVNQKKSQAGSTEPNVLLGQSMGGLVGRYTLAKMEKIYNEDHDVRLFIAHDSPMRGANTPLGVQYFTRHMYSKYIASPILYGVVEFYIPVMLDFLNAIPLVGFNFSSESLNVALTIQDTPAAVQMNNHYVDFYGNATTIPHQTWQQEFDAMGYPQNSRNIAISNGNECAFGHGFEPGDKIISLHETKNYSFWRDWLVGIATGFGGIATSDNITAILGFIPGGSTYNLDFDIHTTPNPYASDRKVYYGKIRYHKHIGWSKWTISHTIMDRTNYAPKGYLPFDSYAGGTYDIKNVANSIPLINFSKGFINPKYGFIPVASALDIRRNNTELYHEDYKKRYAGGSVSYPYLSSGFDNFIVDYNKGNIINNRHISFQTRNGNWLANELNTVSTNTANCSYICTSEITGNDILCDSATFYVPEGALYYNWSITQGEYLVQSSSGNGTNEFTLKRSGGNGIIAIKVTFGDYNQTCGNVTLTKEIQTGSKPYFVKKNPVGEQNGYNPNEWNISVVDGGSACNMVKFQVIFDSYLPILQYEMENTTTGVMCSHTGGGTFNLNSSCNKKFTGNVRARNACGWSDWKYIEHYINRCTDDCPPPPNYTIGENFKLSPNPVNNGLVTVTVNQGAPWYTIYLSQDPNNGLVLEGAEPQGFTNFSPIVNITIFNQSAVQVLSFPNTQLQATLDISALPTGSYIVKIGNNQTENHTIIKL